MGPNPRLVSFDLGNGFVKARSSTEEASYPSVISVESASIQFDMAFSPNHDFIIGFEGKRYAIGHTVYTHGLIPDTTAHRSRIETDFYRVLFASALAATVGQSATVQPVVSLPPSAYWDKEKQKANLSGTYKVEVPAGRGKFRTLTFDVPMEGMRVIPEGVGTICMFVLDENGSEQDPTLFHNPVGIVDVGTYTTDLILLDRLKIIRSGTTSWNHALRDVHTNIVNHVSTYGVDLDTHKVDDVLRQRWFRKGGKDIRIDREIEEWSQTLASGIAGRIRTAWNGGDDVVYILVTGGGGELVYDYLRNEFGDRVYIVEDSPHFANCEGGYRYGLLRQGATR